MGWIRSQVGFLVAGLVFVALSLLALWYEQWFFFGLPVALLGIYFAVFHSEHTFLALFFFVPISVNIEEFTESFGLFIPTEPILAGFLLLFLWQQLRTPFFPNYLHQSPIVWALAVYLSWIAITSITSSHPLVSVKFLIAKLWFVVPVLFYGTRIFEKRENIIRFFWLFAIGMTIAMTYTVLMHASYSFGEKESHWVMWPFFKDHTIYGSIVAFLIPMLTALYFSKKHTPLLQAILLSMMTINWIALYFSYTRAAWLSIVAALFVWLIIRLRIKFSWLFGTTLGIVLLVIASWTQIEQSLAKNKSEHTTEDFGKRLESAANVTTDASNLERLNRWSCAIAMFQERPVFGFGPGTYSFEYARFQEPENLTIISTNFGDAGNAHSEYLGPLSEMGVLGLLTFLALVASIFYSGITLYLAWPAEDREIKYLILGLVLSLVTYFVHGVLNNYLDTDKAAVPIFAACAVFIALQHQLTKSKKTF